MSELILTDRWFEINQKAKNLQAQIQLKADLENRTFKEYVIAAGRRSFKTERFIKRFAIEWMFNNSDQQIFIGGPTRIQAKQIFWDDMKKLFPEWFMKKKSDSELIIKDLNNNQLQIVGLKEFKRVQGQRCHLALISEYQECDEGVWSETFQPMLIDTGGIALKEGRPYGKNHFFDDYQRGLQKNNSVSSYHWTSEAVFTIEQIEQAKSSTGKSDYQREYLASFETDSQSPYYAYSANNHKTNPIRFDLPFILACDFNATTKPMSWVFGQRYKALDIDLMFWKKSFSNKFTNTQTQCEIVWEYWQKEFNNQLSDTLYLYGDYSGRAEKSNSSYSDWQIIENFFRNKFKTIEQRTKPTRSIRDSIASTNAQLCNSFGDKKQFVDETNCKELIQDWLKCEWKANGRELKDDNDDFGHMSRAVDYFNDYEHSIKGKHITTWQN